MNLPIRLLRDGACTGRWNMAADEVLATAGDPAYVATLRFYGWHPAALSLGHHQSADLVDRDALRARGLDLVRRPTGGMAVLHDEELTFALAGPDLRAWVLDLGGTVALLAGALAAALAGRGLGARAEPGRPV